MKCAGLMQHCAWFSVCKSNLARRSTSLRKSITGEIDPAVYGVALVMRRTTMDRILVEAARASGVDVRPDSRDVARR